MIMNGTTPRLLGIGGTLGSLALGLLLLPVNATLAQKSDDKKDVRVIITTDDDAQKSSDEAVVTETKTIRGGGGSGSGFAFGSGVASDGRQEIHLEIRSDDQGASVTASSVDEAITKLKAQIEAIKKKADQSNKDKALVKALERAITELEHAGEVAGEPKTFGVRAVKPKLAVVRMRELKDGDADKLSAETKAEIEKARNKVHDLAQAVQAKQKELAEARTALVQLERRRSQIALARAAAANARIVVDDARSRTPLTDTRKDVRSLPPMIDTRKSADGKDAKTPPGRGAGRSDSRADQKRIDELEKKLEKLLEEVARLKNDRGN